MCTKGLIIYTAEDSAETNTLTVQSTGTSELHNMNNKQQTEQKLHTCMLTKLQYVLYNPRTKFLNKSNNCFCTFYIPDGLKPLFVMGHTRFLALACHSCVFQYAKYLSFPTLLTISCLPKLFTKF